VTVAGTTHLLPPPFFVLATLNPIEMEGTYQLPEAELDRFLFKVRLASPSQEELERILAATTTVDLPAVAPVFAPEAAPERVTALQRLVRQVLVAPHVERYVAHLVRLTAGGTDGASGDLDDEVTRYVAHGASPRGGQALVLGAKVAALLDGRPHVTYDDVDRFAPAALGHRLVMSFAAGAAGVGPERIVAHVLTAARRFRT